MIKLSGIEVSCIHLHPQSYHAGRRLEFMPSNWVPGASPVENKVQDSQIQLSGGKDEL